jgi:hypothetical protein
VATPKATGPSFEPRGPEETQNAQDEDQVGAKKRFKFTANGKIKHGQAASATA